MTISLNSLSDKLFISISLALFVVCCFTWNLALFSSHFVYLSSSVWSQVKQMLVSVSMSSPVLEHSLVVRVSPSALVGEPCWLWRRAGFEVSMSPSRVCGWSWPWWAEGLGLEGREPGAGASRAAPLEAGWLGAGGWSKDPRGRWLLSGVMAISILVWHKGRA